MPALADSGAGVAHPRSRGENVSVAAVAVTLPGSSPLTRGKLIDWFKTYLLPGLIPAHAGKTGRACPPRRGCRAHPRSRGENVPGPDTAGMPGGSSPLTRGKRDRWCRGRGGPGLIPAHAGKTAWRVGIAPDSPGSSPLTRGKQALSWRPQCSHGLIPAHAGKTFGLLRPMQRPWAHPRSRGENGLLLRGVDRATGSSPLTRGKRYPVARYADGSRLIPAHAGKTTATLCATNSSRAHPRSRGENSTMPAGIAVVRGSSPLTRGKHFLTCAFIAQIGQILESLELCASSESYSSPEAYATDALQGRVRSIDLGLRSSRGAS